MELTKISRKRAVDEVYEALREAIIQHVFHPGQRLVVEDLAQKLGVSLTPVRSAIQMLTSDGLVEIHPRSGTFVATLSSQDLEETFDIRLALESLAIEKAIRFITPAQEARLEELLKILAECMNKEDGRQLHDEANHEFHQTLIEASGNKRLLDMYESLNAHIQIARLHAEQTDWRARLHAEQKEHEEMLAALLRKDTRAAVSATRRHIEGAKKALMTQLQGQGTQGTKTSLASATEPTASSR
jgi:GntR family transcriptional regulator, rspAB operon transcriptional repressor